jgi:hypothetical protein
MVTLFFCNENGDSKFLRNTGTKLDSVTFQNTVILKDNNFSQNVWQLKLQFKTCKVFNLTRIPGQKEASKEMTAL